MLISGEEDQELRPLDMEKENLTEFTAVTRNGHRRSPNKDWQAGIGNPDDISPQPSKPPDKKQIRPPKTKAVVLDKPAGTATYAEMVKEVKVTAREQAFSFDITTRRAKPSNKVLEVADKVNADKLAELLRMRFGQSKGVRRPAPSISLLLIGIEDSVDE